MMATREAAAGLSKNLLKFYAKGTGDVINKRRGCCKRGLRTMLKRGWLVWALLGMSGCVNSSEQPNDRDSGEFGKRTTVVAKVYPLGENSVGLKIPRSCTPRQDDVKKKLENIDFSGKGGIPRSQSDSKLDEGGGVDLENFDDVQRIMLLPVVFVGMKHKDSFGHSPRAQRLGDVSETENLIKLGKLKLKYFLADGQYKGKGEKSVIFLPKDESQMRAILRFSMDSLQETVIFAKGGKAYIGEVGQDGRLHSVTFYGSCTVNKTRIPGRDCTHVWTNSGEEAFIHIIGQGQTPVSAAQPDNDFNGGGRDFVPGLVALGSVSQLQQLVMLCLCQQACLSMLQQCTPVRMLDFWAGAAFASVVANSAVTYHD